ncbi:hypothetical protein GEOBRER4_n1821 [Citrifermentans bremense]|uniref:Uncharacterized protein n=1 Tax=Citrifermentans bremense TaxID=60035 RepID=A0A7R7IZ80_9BACT|nr:hypothetical protein GEOBRER4_n1821 [Citrifermentans bremense]
MAPAGAASKGADTAEATCRSRFLARERIRKKVKNQSEPAG